MKEAIALPLPSEMEALFESRALLRETQQIAKVGSWVWDLRTDLVHWSEELYRICGLEPSEGPMKLEEAIRATHPDDRARIAAINAGLTRDREEFRYEHRVLRPDGTMRTVHCRGRVIAGADGAPARIIGSAQDVTDLIEIVSAHQAAEAALAASARHAIMVTEMLRARERALTALSENSPDVIGRFGRDRRHLYVNASAERVTGVPRAELVGRSHAELGLPEEFVRLWERVIDRGFETGEPSEFAFEFVGPAGPRHFEARLVPEREGGTITTVLVIARDITSRLALEEQLRQAQKMEAVGRLAGGVAHDFNNLLTVIQSYTDFAVEEVPEGSSARADLREVQAAARNAAGLTRQLLAFSRQQVLRPQRLDVNDSVSAVAAMLRRVIGEDIRLETQLAPGVCPVNADPGQVEQVLMNLAVNARDAMPQGGILRMRTEAVAIDGPAPGRPGLRPGDYAAVVVEDTGSGISADVMPNIFEPFFTTKGVGRGTGLGLATVYGIVKQSGGFIYVDSTPGEGSRFMMLLPRLVETGEAVAPAERPLRPPRGTERVLLVEDEATVRKAVRRQLERLGYAVWDVSCGPDALALVEGWTERIDLLLTDIVMPGMSGRELAAQLVERHPGMRVVYMSGYTDDDMLRRGLIQPGQSYFQKPITGDRLAAVVRQVLDS